MLIVARGNSWSLALHDGLNMAVSSFFAFGGITIWCNIKSTHKIPTSPHNNCQYSTMNKFIFYYCP